MDVRTPSSTTLERRICELERLARDQTRHLSAQVNCIYVFNGPFEERSVHATPTMSYVSPWMTYRF
jgi:hypothetical protein